MSRALSLRRSLLHLHHHRPKPLSPTTPPPPKPIQNPFSPLNPARKFCTSPTPTPSTNSEVRKYIGYTALVIFCGAATYYSFPFPDNAKHKKAQLFRYAPLPEDLHTVSNWSGTHEVQTRNFYQPENIEQLEKLVKENNEKKARIRPVGSGLSPNGIGLARSGMVNLALMDKVLEVDKEKRRVRVEAGIRVQELVDGIKEYGLTLQNFASIREQQIGGIVQVGAHGTGARLPPIDEQVISMKLVTPAKGTIEISKEKDPELFYLARVGLGGLGVVSEVTLQCVERQELVEHTFISNMKDIKKNHKKLLSENKHVKYLHIPYTDAVVVVTCNPVSKWKGLPKYKPKYTTDEALLHVRDLYKESLEKYRIAAAKSSDDNEPDINELSFTELRDKLLALDPLNKDHVVKINRAEAEFWRKSEGYRVGWSDEILGFDCGGQQWVSENCFPAGTLAKPSLKDLEFIEKLKQLIEKEEIPAPAPIEQRWTARSQSPMSPASSSAEDDIFSWVGIIMYLPTMDARQRKEITEEFFHYRHLTQVELWDKYSAYEHWAKIEVPKDKDELAALKERLRRRFPVDAYNKARKELDPNKILSNNMLEKLFPLSETN
ncbi:L-galactono-1,4-lactone dehydrogenase, mitochondrial [Populus nigra]|uniref:L-galactono-1,4-lactone dehydrogenase, mitochondrial n=1 Tax=Populus nigra TaxID=3691 RepID=UPI002B274E48|nr:L-galactono-1,4-lactone dehydrogenase, mitochondrial [Populus nigra]